MQAQVKHKAIILMATFQCLVTRSQNLLNKNYIPYTAKLSSGKTFAVFAVFQLIAKVFPLNHLLCTVHDGHSLMHRKSFPVNSVFCAQPQKFSHSKVLLYIVFKTWMKLECPWITNSKSVFP